MISNNYNMYELYTPFINQVFNLLHRSRLPAMNICTVDVSLGWEYRWFNFTKDQNPEKIIATNDIGNMICINLANTVNTIVSNNLFDIPTTILTAIAHELSHTEQDIDFYRYKNDNKYIDMIENANQFRTVKFLLDHKEFIENNIYFNNCPLKINESQLLLDYNELKFAESDFVHKEKIKSLFYKLDLLGLANNPDKIQLIRDYKNFIIKDINGREAIIKHNKKYIANYEDLLVLNSFIYQIYHNFISNEWIASIYKTDNNTVIVQSKFSA